MTHIHLVVLIIIRRADLLVDLSILRITEFTRPRKATKWFTITDKKIYHLRTNSARTNQPLAKGGS